MHRLFRRVLLIAVLLGAWALVGNDRVPLPVMFNEAVAGPSARTETFDAPRSGERKSHELSNLNIFHKVIMMVKDNYVDPKRVKPKEMMVAALQYVERSVPDVMVEGNSDSGKLKLNVNGKIREFDISHVDSLWKMSFTLKDIFDFISKNMRPVEDTREVEYAAVNGMLSTLDPHSVLLKPEIYREMKLTTKGEFGGLGFVIQMKEGNLTVVKVLPKTPAYRAGIRRDDQIKKIGEESTVNMDLNEAVSKLRGPVDSRVNITVERKSWEKPQSMTLSRAMITIDSVQSKLLAGNVGYIQLKNFQGNTTRELQSAIRDLAKQADATDGMKGLVLDLRGNPGGLLEQAIQVSDQFLSQGTIVATVGLSDKMREEKRAHSDEGDNTYPLAVLVSANSASASEIVAGALKNLNRAVIIGRQTFGKGSVQVLYDFPDDSALKLTIAKYLTPGDISIQEVGIVPDIQLTPTRVTKDRVNVFTSHRTLGEADLEHHFGNPGSTAPAKKREDVTGREKPAEELKYLKEDAKHKDVTAQKPQEDQKSKLSKNDAKKGKVAPLDIERGTDEDLDDQVDPETQDEIKEDYEITFARDYVLKAPFTDRQRMLQAGHVLVAEKRKQEEDRIKAAIEMLGIDWSSGPTPQHGQLTASLQPAPEQRIKAGETLDLDVVIENKGTETFRRLRAVSDSANLFLDRREFIFGSLKPGERRSWKVPIKLPRDFTSRRDDITIKFYDDNGTLPETIVSELNFQELPRPSFAFNWQVIDNCAQCNGDGLVQRGEEIELLVDVKNEGSGKALDSFAQIKNAADQNIFIQKGRFKLGELAPGETKTAKFVLEVKKPYKGDKFPLKLWIIDEPLEEFSTEKLVIPIVDYSLPVENKRSVVRLSEKTDLFGTPNGTMPRMAYLTKAAIGTELGRVGSFQKIELDKGRFAFVNPQNLQEVKSGKATLPKDVEFVPYRVPPEISLSTDTLVGGIVADGEKYTLSGAVNSPNGLLDMYIQVNDQKIFFKGGSKDAPLLNFSSEFPLKEGNNNVLVVARETPEFVSRKAVVIRRRPAAVAQKIVPRLENAPSGVR